MIPSFNGDGNLPPGIHEAKVGELRARFAYNHERKRLFSDLLRVVAVLRESECREIFLNGSFITSAPAPNDYDLCWEPMGVVPTPALKNLLTDLMEEKPKYLGDIFARMPEPPFYLDHVVHWQKDQVGNLKGLIRIIPNDHNEDSDCDKE